MTIDIDSLTTEGGRVMDDNKTTTTKPFGFSRPIPTIKTVTLTETVLTQWEMERDIMLDWVDKRERLLQAAGRFGGRARTAEIRKWYRDYCRTNNL